MRFPLVLNATPMPPRYRLAIDRPSLIQRLYVFLFILLPGACWYWGNGLSGEYWYLVWLAPVPTLVSPAYTDRKTSFLFAFVACLMGRLSWFVYLHTVVPPVLASLLTGALAYAFARIAVYAGVQLCTKRNWRSLFTYPVLMTAFEYLVLTCSPDGTATSMAYTQSDVLPIIQSASLAGTPGITFLVSLFPALCAFGWLAWQQRARILQAAGLALLIYGSVLGYGLLRLHAPMSSAALQAGVVVLDETKHHTDQQDSQQQMRAVLADYGRAITTVAATGAQVVLLPETAFRLTPLTDSLVMNSLRHMAKRANTRLIVGLADYSQPDAHNTAVVIDASGSLLTTYTKRHLVRGFESQFSAGRQTGLFPIDTLQAGVAICKDLDFPGTIRDYGQARTAVLFVPANDFRIDDWLHARMAILRGVENGFSVVRAARHGRLTISDSRGRVLYEAKTTIGNQAQLIGTVPLSAKTTLFAYAGNWFGLLNLVVAFFIVLSYRRRTSVLRITN
ncbi:nitrilase-related carbon-nitrogen hydrolase [uncultured Spirosoma sp.]|uniref:apolipoprotein N-acyltransferase n=1 Tax=uncultured Spirosoma sp. TaxID=278208 RepID=UPI00258D38AB|nr:nitrilase-related carbon-nitrogen hydrolase [uncultured Spirosoma sp.]